MGMFKDLRRRKPTRQAKPRFLIVCEGKVTEVEYLEAVLKQSGNHVVLDFQHRYSDPRSIVRLAAKLKKESSRAAKRDLNQRYEQIWCVFDRDEHPFVGEALDQARGNQIEVAFSDPSFELWLLLHFQQQTAPLDRESAARLCRNFMPGYAKRPDSSSLMQRLGMAQNHAEALYARQIAHHRKRQNPWTEMHLLVRALTG